MARTGLKAGVGWRCVPVGLFVVSARSASLRALAEFGCGSMATPREASALCIPFLAAF